MTSAFQHPESLHWLWAVAALGVVAWWGVAARRRGLRRFADHPLVARLAPRLSLFRPAMRAVMSIGGLALLVAALADPRWGVRYVETDQRGMDVVFVMDVSRSMLAGDASPNRLDRARLFVEDAVDAMAGDRVGLVDFAGDATMRSPLTLNYDAFKTALSELSPRDALRGGSMLGDAIREAAEAFPDDEPVGKAIVILTDGEDMDSFPVEAAESAWREHGARVYTIGIGDAGDGARIPTFTNGQRTWVRHDGAEVWSRMDPDLLREVADNGGGVFVEAGTSLVDLGEFFDDWITTIDQRDRGTSTAREMIPRFRWFAVPAFILLLMDSIVSNRRRSGSRTARDASFDGSTPRSVAA